MVLTVYGEAVRLSARGDGKIWKICSYILNIVTGSLLAG